MFNPESDKKPTLIKEKPITATSIFRQTDSLELITNGVLNNMNARVYDRMGREFEQAITQARTSYAMCYRHGKNGDNTIKRKYALEACEAYMQVGVLIERWRVCGVVNKKKHASLAIVIGELQDSSWKFYQSLQNKE